MADPLDKPIWTALTTRQTKFAIGSGSALRFRPTVEPFIASVDESPASLDAMAGLIASGEELILLQANPSPMPPGAELVSHRTAVQMVADRAESIPFAPQVEPLSDKDADQMCALAELTRPGPFLRETHLLAQFWGIRENGRIVAMAGERMKLPGLSEVSGVCTHPDAQGRGFGTLLFRLVAGLISARGERPFLHAYADNAVAIRLYEKLGFKLRREMSVQLIRRIL